MSVIIGGIWLWDYFFPVAPPSVLPKDTTATRLTDAEVEYYRQVFDYTMAVTKAGEHYDWESYSGKGSLTPGEVFVSKSGANCRSFSETYTIGTTSASAEGVACKREGKDGWCRLRKVDAQTCAMEPPASLAEKATRGTQDAVGAAKDVMGKAWGALR